MSEQTQRAQSIADRVLQGDLRALARAISLIEDDTAVGREIVARIFPHTGQAYLIGVTGAPGAGKSTLVDQLIRHLNSLGKKVAVLAIDPSSPFTGGALLGDRIRMLRAAELDGVFIRSMASRGALGGLAPQTSEVLFALDAAGFDYIVIETVGVGQGEVEIVRYADAVALVLVPGMGDGVQALKAGVIEIADVFVINKADYPGADSLQKELIAVMGLGGKQVRPTKIIQTIASTGSGIPELADELSAYRAWAAESGEAKKRKDSFLSQAFEREVAAAALKRILHAEGQGPALAAARAKLLARKIDPVTLAEELVDSVAADKTSGSKVSSAGKRAAKKRDK